MCWRNCSAPFFAIWTSKSRPNARCFVHFDLQMRFAPQRHAIFRHRNFKKWSEAEVSCAFWLENVFCAKAACHFLTSQLQKTVRTWGGTSRAMNHWKNTAICDFPNIWRACIFFLVTLLACWSSFFWLDFSGLLFNCPYCRKVDF